MIKTYHETKRYKEESNYFWFKNESYKEEFWAIYFGSMSSSPQISLDGTNWETNNNNGYYVKPGHKIYIRCSDGYFFAEGDFWYYSGNMSGKWSVGGPLASLIDYTDQSNVTAIPAHCFHSMFSSLAENGYLFDCSELDFGNITEVGDYGMSEMFRNCPFKAGYVDFSGITELGDYAMYSCFYSSDLKSADLSNVTVLGTEALNGTFYSAYNLNEIHAPNVQTWDEYKTANWLEDAGSAVTGTKTFYAPTGVTIPTNTSGIPTGWTRVDY